jgi:ADP-ribose pyrophosphatase YjhB (NUDIX family)
MADSHLIADISQKALLTRGGRVLLVMDADGDWELPGGRLDIGETPEEGLRRELREELGLAVEPQSVVSVFPCTSRAGHVHFTVVWLCRAVCDLDALAIDGDEVREARWVTPAECEPLRMHYAGHLEAIKKYLQAAADDS